MLAPKFLIAGIGTIAICSSAVGIFGTDSIKQIFTKDEKSNKEPKDLEYDYLIVSSSEITDSQNNDSLSEIPAISIDNYSCELSKTDKETEIDKTCALYKLNTTEKIVDLYKTFKSPDEQKITEAPAANKKFILKIRRDFLNSLKQDSKIKLVNKDKNEKRYLELTKIHKLNQDNQGFKTNLILAKVTSKETISDQTGNVEFQCKFKSENKVDCSVFKLVANPSNNNDADVSGASKMTKLNSVTTNAPSANDYVLIEIKGNENYKTEKELRSFVPEIYVKNVASNGAKFLTTEYIDSYVGEISQNNSTIKTELFKLQKSAQDYLVVVSSVTANGTKATDAWNVANEKNYKCKVTDSNIEDLTCKLISITGDANKSADFAKIESLNTEETNKDNFADKKYFKLIVNSPELMSQDFSSKTITIASTKDNTKSYGTVKVISKFLHEERTGKTEWFLVKGTKSHAVTTSVSGFKCKYESNDSYTSCDVYKTSTLLNDANYKNFNLTGFSKQTINQNDFNNDKYLIVKLTEEKDIKVPQNKTISISTTTSGTDTEFTQLKVISPISSQISSDANQIENNPILLS